MMGQLCAQNIKSLFLPLATGGLNPTHSQMEQPLQATPSKHSRAQRACFLHYLNTQRTQHMLRLVRKPSKDSLCSPGEGGDLENCSKAVVRSHS